MRSFGFHHFERHLALNSGGMLACRSADAGAPPNSAAPFCRPNLVNGRTDVSHVGDSITMSGSLGPPVTVGTYRVQAFFEAENGRPPTVERTIVVR